MANANEPAAIKAVMAKLTLFHSSFFFYIKKPLSWNKQVISLFLHNWSERTDELHVRFGVISEADHKIPLYFALTPLLNVSFQTALSQEKDQ